MGNVVITIAREYGSGGRTIGDMLAKKMGISFYDKDILRIASEESGIHQDLFRRVDEYTSAKTPLFKKNSTHSSELRMPGDKEFTSDENLFNYQAKVIRELAETESCVIIGRCSNHILKDCPNVLSVFIHAPMDYRLQESAKKQSGSTRDIEKFLAKDDKRKLEYYQRYAGGEWRDAVNYDMCLDSSKLGYDKCVDMIRYRANLMK